MKLDLVLAVVIVSVGVVAGSVLLATNNLNYLSSDNNVSNTLEFQSNQTDSGILASNYEYIPTLSSKDTVSKNNNFAFDFYRQIIKENNGNVFFSPWSIFVAFGIVY